MSTKTKTWSMTKAEMPDMPKHVPPYSALSRSLFITPRIEDDHSFGLLWSLFEVRRSSSSRSIHDYACLISTAAEIDSWNEPPADVKWSEIFPKDATTSAQIADPRSAIPR